MFSDPAFARQMGGEYVSDWKAGSLIGWKGVDGTMLTNGKILRIEPEKLLQHSLFTPGTTYVMATVLYELSEKNGVTTLNIREDLMNPVSDEEHHAAMTGWQGALGTVKELLEKEG